MGNHVTGSMGNHGTGSLSNFGKLRLMIHIGDLNVNITIGGVHLDDETGKHIYEPGHNDKIYVNVQKIDLEFGNRLISNTYHFRGIAEPVLTSVVEFSQYLVDLVNDNWSLGQMPKRNIAKNKSRQEELVNMEIKREVRALKIDSIV